MHFACCEADNLSSHTTPNFWDCDVVLVAQQLKHPSAIGTTPLRTKSTDYHDIGMT